MGSSTCQLILGKKIRPPESVSWFRRAAIQGDSSAQQLLAYTYDLSQNRMMSLCLHHQASKVGQKAPFDGHYIEPTDVCPNCECSDFQEESEIVEAVCGRPSEPKIAKDALDWLLTQNSDEAEYFMRDSETLKGLKRAVEDLLPMPISEEIVPCLAAL
jgi:hypothetical protein